MTPIHQSQPTHESSSLIQSLLHDEHVTDWMWATSEWADEDELDRYTEHAMNDHDAHVVTHFYYQHKIDEQFAIWAETSHPFTPQDADLDIPF